MSEKKKFRFPFFYVFLLLLIVAVVVLVNLFTGVLKDYLVIYEEAQPEYKAQSVYEAYFQGYVDYAKLYEFGDYQLKAGDTPEDVVTLLKEKQAGRTLVMEQVSSMENDVLRFVLMAGEDKMAAFNLRRGDVKTFEYRGRTFEKLLWLFSCYEWNLDKIELFWSGDEAVAVSVPWNARVYVNGILQDESAITGEIEWTESQQHMPKGVSGLGYVVYEADGFVSKPEVRAESFQGKPLRLVEVSEGYFEAQIENDTLLEKMYGVRVLNAVKTYACYMQEEASLSAVANFFDTTSVLYSNIRTSVQVVWEHDSYEFQNVAVDHFYAYDASTFSCHVTFRHVLHKGKVTWSDEPLNMTVYCRLINGVCYVYDMTNYLES